MASPRAELEMRRIFIRNQTKQKSQKKQRNDRQRNSQDACAQYHIIEFCASLFCFLCFPYFLCFFYTRLIIFV